MVCSYYFGLLGFHERSHKRCHERSHDRTSHPPLILFQGGSGGEPPQEKGKRTNELYVTLGVVHERSHKRSHKRCHERSHERTSHPPLILFQGGVQGGTPLGKWKRANDLYITLGVMGWYFLGVMSSRKNCVLFFSPQEFFPANLFYTGTN